jgi:hypothetical protein
VKIRNYYWLILVALFAITSCKKSDPATPTDNPVVTGTVGATGTTGSAGPDVYVSGGIRAANGFIVAAYWKNGVLHKLTDSTTNCYAYGIAVAGNDVYIQGQLGGLYGELGKTIVYWKNGVMVKVGDGYVSNIAVQGNDVYLVGWTLLPYLSGQVPAATYWKNGNPVLLKLNKDDMSSIATSIAVKGSDIYVTANVSTNDHKQVGVCWKNNQVSTFTDTSANSSANGVVINGDDVYVCGSSRVKNIGDWATYWKNGAVNLVGTPTVGQTSTAFAIAVSGSDVYLGGVDHNVFTYPAYWKNGVEVINKTFNGSTGYYNISVDGSNFYGTAAYDYTATYWKNADLVRISGTKQAFAYHILVVAH